MIMYWFGKSQSKTRSNYSGRTTCKNEIKKFLIIKIELQYSAFILAFSYIVNKFESFEPISGGRYY